MGNQMSENNEKLYDVVIIGGGPAGLTAAIYLARAHYRVIVVEKETFGGQITITSEIVNYPGIESTSGRELTGNMRKQAENFGAEFLLGRVKELQTDGEIKRVLTDRGQLQCFGILLATGAHPRMIGFRGEAEFKGHGVAYCATCDGEFFTGKEVFVVGGGFAAAEESVFLTKYASRVTILIREEDFTCAETVAEKARRHEKIRILTNVVVEEVAGDTVLRSITYRNLQTGEVTEYHAPQGDTFGVFVFAGYEPETELVKGIAELTEQGYVVTDSTKKTNVDGLYAAGDVCVKNLRQVVTAVGDGALAATELERYAAAMQAKTCIKPELPKRPLKPGSVVSGHERTGPESNGQGKLFTEEMLTQLYTVFGKMERSLILKLYLDEREVSSELRAYMEELAALTDKLTVELAAEKEEVEHPPCVRVCDARGEYLGLAFHGVPGGHEFTSFILGLYNAAGPGQPLEEQTREQIRAIQKPLDIRIMVSLTCTMCPELVAAAQRIAAENENVTAQVYDLNHFQDMKEQYQVMSVPCMVINEGAPLFGKKNVEQLLEILKDL